MRSKFFLTAEWRKLVMANYVVDPAILKKYVPTKTELDYFDNNCYVSLVGFMFQQVKVKGFRIPFHVNFPEVNLRFYVRYKDGLQWKRGVVFISEIVPRPLITIVANTLYKEHYSSLPMQYTWETSEDYFLIRYSWKKNKQWNKLEVKADRKSLLLQEGSFEEFITEHFWGYSDGGNDRTFEYRVAHPRWDIYNVREFVVNCDFAGLYGQPFAFLSEQEPVSVFLAEGSPIEVFTKKVL